MIPAKIRCQLKADKFDIEYRYIFCVWIEVCIKHLFYAVLHGWKKSD